MVYMEGIGQNTIDGFEGDDEREHCFPRIESGFETLMSFVEGRSADDVGEMQERGYMIEDDCSDVNHHRSPQSASLSDSTSKPNIEAEIDSIERASDLLLVVSLSDEPTRTKIIELAHSAMDELTKMALAGKHLWRTPQNVEKYETLNYYEYLREFSHVDATLRDIIQMVEVGEPNSLPCFDFDSYQIEDEFASIATPEEAFQVEASRDIAYVRMSSRDVVEMLMDLEQWSGAFCSIVSRPMILEVLSNGVKRRSFDGKLQLISAEFHLPTTFVRSRGCYFARYCKQLCDTMWGVVDISLEKYFPYPSISLRRRPSGCLIQEMPQGFSKVTWVEHVEADYREMNTTFWRVIRSGFAFSATRWIGCIVRQYEFSEALNKARYTPPDDAGMVIGKAGRASILKLAEIMTRSFCIDIGATTQNLWMLLPPSTGPEDVRVRIKDNIQEPAKHCATTVVFSTSQWLPVSSSRLFDFLRDQSSRNKWDLLSRGLGIREVAHIVKGKDPANRVSIMQATDALNKIVINYLQESYTGVSGSYVIYAPLDTPALQALVNGGNPDIVAILPSGFAILPDINSTSILTLAFHIVDNASSVSYMPPQSVSTIHKIVRDTIIAIENAMLPNNPLDD